VYFFFVYLFFPFPFLFLSRHVLGSFHLNEHPFSESGTGSLFLTQPALRLRFFTYFVVIVVPPFNLFSPFFSYSSYF